MVHRFDHGHIKSRDPRGTAQWWAEVFGAKLREQGMTIFEVRETPTSKIAFVEAPDAVRVELMQRRG